MADRLRTDPEGSSIASPQVLLRPDPSDIPQFAIGFDGGGLYGIAQLVVYLAFCDLVRKAGFSGNIQERTTLTAGSSTGAIIALGLNTRLNGNPDKPVTTPEQLLGFYLNHAADIFPQPKNTIESIRKRLPLGSKHLPEPLRKGLTFLFGENTTLEQAQGNVAILAHRLDTGHGVIFSSRPSQNPHHDIFLNASFNAVSTIMASCAAPTLLPPHPIQSTCGKHQFTALDGFLAGNSPNIYALHMLDHTKPIQFMSFGTGTVVPKTDPSAWNPLDWVSTGKTGVSPIPNAMRNASNIRDDFLLAQQLGAENYTRLNITIDKLPYGIDNSSQQALTFYQQFGEQIIDANRDRMAFCAQRFAQYARPREVPVVVATEPQVVPVKKESWLGFLIPRKLWGSATPA